MTCTVEDQSRAALKKSGAERRRAGLGRILGVKFRGTTVLYCRLCDHREGRDFKSRPMCHSGRKRRKRKTEDRRVRTLTPPMFLNILTIQSSRKGKHDNAPLDGIIKKIN